MASIYSGGFNPFAQLIGNEDPAAINPSWGNNFTNEVAPQSPGMDFSTQAAFSPSGQNSNFGNMMNDSGLYNTAQAPANPFALQGNSSTVVQGPAQNTVQNPTAPQQNTAAPLTPPTAPQQPPSAFGNALATSLQTVRDFGNQQVPNSPQQNNPQMNSQQQAWMNANSSGWGDDLMKFMLGGGGDQFKFDPMNIQWLSDNGAKNDMTRATGVLQQGGGDALAKLLGGTLVQNPIATYGSQQRDNFIRMPNGQMIDTSTMGNSLKNAMSSSNPFSALSDIINLYQSEARNFNPQTNPSAIDLVNQGKLQSINPQNYNPGNFVGGQTSYMPSGPTPGNPSNPGMGPINSPAPTQTGIPNPGIFPPSGQQQSQSPTQPIPQPNNNVPQQQAPQGVNNNFPYYLNSPQRNGLFSSQGLYAQTGRGGGGAGGGATIQQAGTGTGNTGTNTNSPFQAPRPRAQASSAGNMPNGSRIIGG
ncbi:hypothetical protein UFOVP434_40 [uncultured Caudovirales phage]|uniref:Uncharacterized protein n=1 Tax=uncultured Caudovirales phage TaxID=2100421 RepID=A0A6J5M9B6_9CAUD|nr:hypothetical protein UFOVP434_40 [uncultured Caudovirales phage]